MSSSKNGKGSPARKKPNTSSGPVNQLKDWFRTRNPILKFLLGFAGCMALFYIFYYSPLYRNYLELPFLNFQAHAGNFFLHLLGYDTAVADAAIAGTEFTVNIKNGCDGLEAMAIFASGIVIFPAAVRYKLTGLAWGLGALLILNFLRIAGLYLAGLYFSKTVFDILHIQGGFILFTMISVLLWFVWMNWSAKKIREAGNA
ncbi:MAG: archaeosortase/exosortase family protein [Lewinella sp.]|nr:archaeosortase/exosortase family protein [Lewinella sp.]